MTDKREPTEREWAFMHAFDAHMSKYFPDSFDRETRHHIRNIALEELMRINDEKKP